MLMWWYRYIPSSPINEPLILSDLRVVLWWSAVNTFFNSALVRGGSFDQSTSSSSPFSCIVLCIHSINPFPFLLPFLQEVWLDSLSSVIFWMHNYSSRNSLSCEEGGSAMLLHEVLLALAGQTGKVIQAKDDGFYLSSSSAFRDIDAPERDKINVTCRNGFLYRQLSNFVREHSHPCSLFPIRSNHKQPNLQTRGSMILLLLFTVYNNN